MDSHKCMKAVERDEITADLSFSHYRAFQIQLDSFRRGKIANSLVREVMHLCNKVTSKLPVLLDKGAATERRRPQGGHNRTALAGEQHNLVIFSSNLRISPPTGVFPNQTWRISR